MKQSFIKTANYISIIVSILISVSCISTQYLTIEIPQKSKNELPQSIQSLLLVSRVVDNQYTDLASDSLQKIFYKQNFNYDTIINDIQAVDTSLKALGELLFESGRYDFVIPENRFLEFEKNAFLTKEMSWEEVKLLCETYQTDAVLSMDHFKTRVSTSFTKKSYFDSNRDGFYSAATAEMKIYYETLFRIYDPVQEKVLIREFLRDTVVWEDFDTSTGVLFDRFTPVKLALSECGIVIALDFSDKISTVRREEQRSFFFKGDKNLKNAWQFANSDNWDAAMALWRDTAEKTKSKSLKSKAELNIAVGYELLGDLDQAVYWALKSYDSMYRTVTYNYLDVLKRRKNELKKQQ